MKKSELQKLIKEELKLIVEDKKTIQDIEGLVATFLSEHIDKHFMKFIKSGMVSPKTEINTKESPSARRAKQNTVEFFIAPTDLKKSTINVELVINVNQRD